MEGGRGGITDRAAADLAFLKYSRESMTVEGEEEEEEDGNMQRHRKSLGTDISFGWKLSGLVNISKYIEKKICSN